MELRTESVSNKTYWLKNMSAPQKDIHIVKDTSCNVAAGESILLYLLRQDTWEEIACLHKVDYNLLMECIQEHTEIDLSYCFIDMREWGEVMRLLKRDVRRSLNSLKAPHSFWYSYANQQNNPAFADFDILHGDMDFREAVFVSTDFFLKNIRLLNGHMNFREVYGCDSECILENISGTEKTILSFTDSVFLDSHLQLIGAAQETLLRFSGSHFESCPIRISGSRSADMHLDIRSSAHSLISLPHMSIAEIHFPSGTIQKLDCHQARFTDQFQIDGEIGELILEDTNILGSGRINARISDTANIRGIRIAGKLYMREFGQLLLRGKNTIQLDPSDYLTLIENFRSVGDYENEDTCFRNYKRNITAHEKRTGRRISGYLIDWLCGYGTYPFRMLAIIFLLIIIFGLLYFLVPVLHFSNTRNLFDCIYVSGITFFTVGYGDIVPLNTVTRLAVVIESCLGVGMMSGFLAVLTHKIIR